jgi:hypothetical protein
MYGDFEMNTKFINEIRDGSYDVNQIRQAITHLLSRKSVELKSTSEGGYSWRINDMVQCKFHVQPDGAIGGLYLVLAHSDGAHVVWL